MTLHFTMPSVDMAGDLAAATERPLSFNAQTWKTNFETDLQVAQLVEMPRRGETAPPIVSQEDHEALDDSNESSLAEQMMWLGVVLQHPIELCPDGTAASPSDEWAPPVPSNTPPKSLSEFPHVSVVGFPPFGESEKELSTPPRSSSGNPDTVDSLTDDPGSPFSPEAMSPVFPLPFATVDESLLPESSSEVVPRPHDNQTARQQTIVEEHHSLDVTVPDADPVITVGQSAGYAPLPTHEGHTTNSPATSQTPLHPRGGPVELRTELSEVVRHVRTMVTEHDTRSTIHLEPVELGRMTLELVDAPEGLKAHLSAEDPAVQRFLEQNVRMLEIEARSQGVSHLSFSVGANLSGGLGRHNQQQSETEKSLWKDSEWNSTSHSKPRSSRELDTNA